MCQLTGACSLTHRFVVVGTVAVTCSIEHSALGVVHLSGKHTGKGQQDVGRYLVISFHRRPLVLFQSGYALKVNHVGVGTIESGGLAYSVEVDHQFVFGGHFGCAIHKVKGQLVIAVDEVYLESLYAHLRVGLAHAFHVTFKGVVAGPKDDAHVSFASVVNQFLDVDFRNHLEEVGFQVNGPTFV